LKKIIFGDNIISVDNSKLTILYSPLNLILAKVEKTPSDITPAVPHEHVHFVYDIETKTQPTIIDINNTTEEKINLSNSPQDQEASYSINIKNQNATVIYSKPMLFSLSITIHYESTPALTFTISDLSGITNNGQPTVYTGIMALNLPQENLTFSEPPTTLLVKKIEPANKSETPWTIESAITLTFPTKKEKWIIQIGAK